MSELMETKQIATYETMQNNTASTESAQMKHIVICGSCGSQERPVGPNKTECPNCDDYIY